MSYGVSNVCAVFEGGNSEVLTIVFVFARLALSNNTFDLELRLQGRKTIGSKWVYKIKRLANGSVERLKAR